MKDKLNLQFSQLVNALTRLKEARALPSTQINRDATIQRFEFTFELTWKLLQNFIRKEGLQAFGPRDAIRAAAQFDLIKDIDLWFDFLDARNLSSHIYNEEMADDVYEIIQKFILEAEKLILKLKSRIS